MIYNTDLLLFVVIDSYGSKQTESNIVKTEYQQKFQQRLQSRQITPKYRNIQEITGEIFYACSSMSKVQKNKTEITKHEVHSAIKNLLAHASIVIKLILKMKSSNQRVNQFSI